MEKQECGEVTEGKQNLVSKSSSKSPTIKITSAQSMDKTLMQQQSPCNMAEQRQNGPAVADSTSNWSNSDTVESGPNQPSRFCEIELRDVQQQQQTRSGGSISSSQTYAYKMRWVVLAIFCSHSAVNSFQWIQYSSITNVVSEYYGVDNLKVNLTSLVYMITYIPFIIHASLLLERIGLRYAICIGAGGTALGSLTKYFLSCEPNATAFWSMLFGQTIVALSQLFIISIPPLLAAVWFPDHQVSTATGIGVFGNQLGIALGFIVPPLVVSGASADKSIIGYELSSLELSISFISLVIFGIALVLLKDHPPKPPGSASLHAANQHKQALAQQQATETQIVGTSGTHTISTTNESNNGTIETFASIKQLCKERDFQLLALSYGINVGCFYAISTVLNQMIAKTQPNPDELSGTMGLLIVVSGMVGSVVCGQLLDRTHAFKLIIVLIYLCSLVSMIIFTGFLELNSETWSMYLASILLGFFMTGYLPLGFEFAAEITYPHPANTPAGLLNLSAQVFGLVLTYTSSLIVDKPKGDLWANAFLNACLTIGLVLTTIMKADLKRQKAVAEEQIKI